MTGDKISATTVIESAAKLVRYNSLSSFIVAHLTSPEGSDQQPVGWVCQLQLMDKRTTQLAMSTRDLVGTINEVHQDLRQQLVDAGIDMDEYDVKLNQQLAQMYPPKQQAN